jgi:hypothetical protein
MMKCIYEGEWGLCAMRDVVVWGGETLMTDNDGYCCEEDYDLCDWCEVEEDV